ncbi:MAG: hypothetical protein MR949_02100 [Veillonellaceae bacterium]|nr:hypothetical protein [Veillonellaceae bacterium]
MKLLLNEHKAYKWQNKFNVTYRGEVFFKEKLYRNKELGDLLSTWTVEDVVTNVSCCNGNFFFIFTFDDVVYAFTDKIMSFPLCWCQCQGEVYLSDDVHELPGEKTFSKEGISELLSFGYVLGNNSIYENIHTIQAGEYIKIYKSSNVEKLTYYKHLHHEIDLNENVLLNKLDNVINNVFDRFVIRLNRRQVVLFLSGGYDSRLILLNLIKRNYNNIVCVTLVSSEDKDVRVARQLAKKFNLNLITVNFTKKYWKQKANSAKFWEFVDKEMNGVALHYLQGMVIQDIIEKNLISKNCVVVTGNSGDVVEGNDICENFVKSQMYTKEDVIKEIIEYHGVNIVNNKDVRMMISKHIGRLLPCRDGVLLSYSEAQDMFEYFNWIERQCKYVTSDARNYDDYIGVEWLLPLWDDEFVEYWQSVPMDLRYKRKLYYKYVKHDNLPTANKASLFLKLRNMLNKRFPFVIKFFYPIRQIFGYTSNDIIYSYCGVVNIWEYVYLQYKTLGNKNKFITPILYKFFRKKYDTNIFYLCDEKK